jgi:two-component sensor histidine kinase
MDQRENALLQKTQRISTGILALLALAGIALSIQIARREAGQYEALQRLRVEQAADVQFAAVQDHLALREHLATVVGALFKPPLLSALRPLGDFGNHVIALVPDIATVGWLPEIELDRVPEALAALAAAGMPNPQFLGSDGQPLDPDKLGRPLYPIVDIAPERNRTVLGVDAGSFPERLAAIRRARETSTVSGTAPLRLVQAPGSTALLIYAPVFDSDRKFRGVLGFGYQVEHLVRSALNVSKVHSEFDIRVYAENDKMPLLAVAPDGSALSTNSETDAPRTVIERKAQFGGRTLSFVYSVDRDIARESYWRGWLVAGTGLALTFTAVAFLGLMVNRAGTLAREVGSRRSAEDRLKVLIHELNHRVRNVLSVAQAVVRLSFTSAYSLAEVQRICEGRLQALANAMTLLTASDWKSVSIRHLILQEIVPFSDRILLKGPDIPLKARAAQTFALLIYELATNATKHGALSVSTGKVLLEWTMDYSGPEPLFRLIWREVEGPTITPPTRRGFGELLVRRIAPRDVAGRGKVSYEASGFEYELEAPLHEVLYERGAAGAARDAADGLRKSS